MLNYNAIFNLHFQNNANGHVMNTIRNKEYTLNDVIIGYSYIFSDVAFDKAARSMMVENAFILLLHSIFRDVVNFLTDKIFENYSERTYPKDNIHDVIISLAENIPVSDVDYYETISESTHVNTDMIKWIDETAAGLSIFWTKKS